jgi:hypothetical protein
MTPLNRQHSKAQRAARARAAFRLSKSKKFQSWPIRAASAHFSDDPIEQKHFSPAELAKAWGVSVETIRSIFRTEPGVLKLGKTGAKYRRGYVTLRIPEEVAQRVHRRLSA